MQTVLVTGISGYIGSHCALELLKSGYRVKGSVRSLAKTDKIKTAFQRIIDIKDNLEFCKLDLLQDEGWQEAMQNVDYVLHVASPFFTKEPKDENNYIQPAVEGTQRTLKSAHKAAVKRVVLTSSMVAMLGGKKGKVNLDQESWTDVDAKNVSAYIKSKTLAEKSAWEFIKNQKGEKKLQLTTIHPGPVYGPTLTGNLDGESMSTYQQLITGKMSMLPQAAINISDVRDVAKIHVQALKNEHASGQRFIVATEKAYPLHEMAQILKANGYEKVSTKLAPNWLLKFLSLFNNDLKGMRPYIGNEFHADVSATKEVFNWKPIAMEKTVLDTAKSVEQAM